MRRFLTAVVLVAGAVASATAASTPSASAALPAAASGGLGVRLVDAPTSGRDDPRARVYIVDRLAPGAVIQRRVEVANGTPGAVQVAVYPAAAEIRSGSFLGSAGRTRNELSTWTTTSPANPKLAAGAKRMVMVTVAVPKDAAPGERYGVVWAEVRSAAAKGAGVTQVSRVGIRLYVSIGPGGAPAANFAVSTLTAQRSTDGSPTVVATVSNTGGRALDMSGTLKLAAGPGGLSAGPFPAVLGTTLAPGQQEPVRIALDKQLPAGPWMASLTLKSGLVQRSVQARITFPAKGSAAPVTATAGASRSWWIAVALALVVLALAGLVLLWVRRRRRAPAAPTSERELLPTP